MTVAMCTEITILVLLKSHAVSTRTNFELRIIVEQKSYNKEELLLESIYKNSFQASLIFSVVCIQYIHESGKAAKNREKPVLIHPVHDVR